MEVETIKTIAEGVARDLLKLGGEHGSLAHRIQFMGGEYPDNEIGQGGLCEESLANFIEKSLRQRMP